MPTSQVTTELQLAEVANERTIIPMVALTPLDQQVAAKMAVVWGDMATPSRVHQALASQPCRCESRFTREARITRDRLVGSAPTA